MLVLTRKDGEEIQISNGDGDSKVVIDITIVHVGQNAVKVGISAPGDWRILRGELVGTRVDCEG